MSAQVTAPVLPEIIYPATAKIESLRPVYSPEQKVEVKAKIKKLLKEQDAVLIAHYYVDRELQELAEETGGYVSDSLDMAKFGNEHPAKTLIVAGVRFMGETAKILTPEKRVYNAERQTTTEAAIRPTLRGDDYAVLGDGDNKIGYTLRLYYKPLVSWIWGGAVIMALGGLIAAFGRQRAATKQASLPQNAASALSTPDGGA